MKKNLFIGALTILLFTQCQKKTDPFLIQEGSIGELSMEIQMRQIDSIYANDSIVKLNPNSNAISTQGEVEIFEKGGAKLLLLSPENESDPNSQISFIQVFDKRYKTDKGFGVGSTFKDLKVNYSISNIETALNNVNIYLNDSDIFLTIDKKQLPENLRYDPDVTIESSQIPDGATFKYFMIAWVKE